MRHFGAPAPGAHGGIKRLQLLCSESSPPLRSSYFLVRYRTHRLSLLKPVVRSPTTGPSFLYFPVDPQSSNRPGDWSAIQESTKQPSRELGNGVRRLPLAREGNTSSSTTHHYPFCDFSKSAKAPHLGSTSASLQLHSPRFKLFPHTTQRPRQFSRHNGFMGISTIAYCRIISIKSNTLSVSILWSSSSPEGDGICHPV